MTSYEDKGGTRSSNFWGRESVILDHPTESWFPVILNDMEKSQKNEDCHFQRMNSFHQSPHSDRQIIGSYCPMRHDALIGKRNPWYCIIYSVYDPYNMGVSSNSTQLFQDNYIYILELVSWNVLLQVS